MITKNEVRRTPGPWILADEGKINNRAIVMVGNGRFRKQIIIRDPEEMNSPTADARLIASAPELLEACKAILNTYMRLANSGDAGNWDSEADKEVIQAKLAIAKAEGK